MTGKFGKKKNEPIDLGYGYRDELLPLGRFGVEAIGGPVIKREAPEKLQLDSFVDLPQLTRAKAAFKR